MAKVTFKDRIKILTRMGEIFGQVISTDLAESVCKQNPMFTAHSINLAMKSWSCALTKEKINTWLSAYPDIEKQNKVMKVQVVMAGNLPFVGLHDLITVFISGHHLEAKLSSKDSILIPWLIETLSLEYPNLSNQISFSSELCQDSQAIILTGTDLTISTLSKNYAHLPGIFRGNRNSIGILSGSENTTDLDHLILDIKSYFGLGCRNVSQLFIPNLNSLHKLKDRLEQAPYLSNNLAYKNSLNQQRALLTMNSISFIDGNEMIFVESTKKSSSIGVIHYTLYNDLVEVHDYINENKDTLQCLVSHSPDVENAIPFGQAQYPELWDYADGKDSLVFLQNLTWI